MYDVLLENVKVELSKKMIKWALAHSSKSTKITITYYKSRLRQLAKEYMEIERQYAQHMKKLQELSKKASEKNLHNVQASVALKIGEVKKHYEKLLKMKHFEAQKYAEGLKEVFRNMAQYKQSVQYTQKKVINDAKAGIKMIENKTKYIESKVKQIKDKSTAEKIINAVDSEINKVEKSGINAGGQKIEGKLKNIYLNFLKGTKSHLKKIAAGLGIGAAGAGAYKYKQTQDERIRKIKQELAKQKQELKKAMQTSTKISSMDNLAKIKQMAMKNIRYALGLIKDKKEYFIIGSGISLVFGLMIKYKVFTKVFMFLKKILNKIIKGIKVTVSYIIKSVKRFVKAYL